MSNEEPYNYLLPATLECFEMETDQFETFQTIGVK